MPQFASAMIAARGFEMAGQVIDLFKNRKPFHQLAVRNASAATNRMRRMGLDVFWGRLKRMLQMKSTTRAVVVALGTLLALFATEVHAAVLWASGSSPNVVYSLDSTTGAVMTSFVGQGGFSDAVSLNNDGNSLWTLDSSPSGFSRVFRVSLTGTLISQFSIGLDAEGLTVLSNGTLVIGGGTSNTIAFVSQLGVIQSSFTPVAQVFGLASNAAGDRIYGLRLSGGVIDTYDLAGNHLGTLTPNVGGLGTTLGLAYTGTSFYISSVSTGQIYEMDLTGNVFRSFVAPNAFTEGLDFGVQVSNAVPEPASLTIFGCVLGLASAAALRRRKGTA